MRNFTAVLLLAIVALSSCHSHKKALRRKAEREAAARPAPGYRKLTTDEYIATYRQAAVRQMKKYGIPASIILAQGILESANGNSELARNANNHFGIKCTSEWHGKTYHKDDDRRNECFRKYPDVDASFRDHSEFLSRPRYAQLFRLRTSDYKGWARGLKQAGYATDPKYPERLINLVERYRLDRIN